MLHRARLFDLLDALAADAGIERRRKTVRVLRNYAWNKRRFVLISWSSRCDRSASSFP
jgi:hypothetical protein